MKFKRIVLAATLLAITAAVCVGCGKKTDLSAEAVKLVGSWAYNHDSKTEIIRLKSNGTAKYNKEKYTFEADGTFITLTDDAGQTQTLRYVLESDGMLLYQTTEYTYSGAGEPEGIIGTWENPNKWSFEFTEEGTFMEDGYFPGYYILDSASNSAKLIYTDQFEDTTIYFQESGTSLAVEYPWKMVKTGTK